MVTALRYSLAIIFMWFGALKVFGFNPVYDLIYNSMAPFLADGMGFLILGIVEVVIGILLAFNRLRRITHTALVLHLIGTFSTFIFGWEFMFSPHFPILTLAGEFVVKNLVLLAAGFVVLSESK